MDFEEAAAIVRAGGMPQCPKCGRVLKPAITFFGESLPADALRDAVTEAQEADLMLVLGTSLTVYPAPLCPITPSAQAVRLSLSTICPPRWIGRR